MEYVSPTPWIDAISFGLVLATFTFVIWYLWIPVRAHVFLRQCCRRGMPLFTGYTQIYHRASKDKMSVTFYSIPNALFIGSYLFCCVMAVILLSS